MKKVNEIEIKDPKNFNERLFFSFLMSVVSEIKYGSVDFKITIKNGNITNVKTKSEKSFNFQNDL